MNYTVIGDTVNIAERLQELANRYMTEADDVVVLVSEATVATPGSLTGMTNLGPHRLRGRREEIEVYRLA